MSKKEAATPKSPVRTSRFITTLASINSLIVLAFIAGFGLMVYELAAARILAPAIGSSMYVWTSVIGVIIAALSLGFWVGGRIADERGHSVDVARLFLLVALAMTGTLLLYPTVLWWVAEVFIDQRVAGVVASLLLFAPTSFLLGVISPYLAKLNVTSLETSGRSIASLSMFDAIGGITGTFIAGFVLFGYLGSRETIALVALLMVGASWFLSPSYQVRMRALLSSAIVLIAVACVAIRGEVIQIDTATSHYSIVNVSLDGRDVRGLAVGPGGLQSGIDVANPERLAFWYTQQMANVVAVAPERRSILVLGGGALTLPQYLAQRYPEAQIDVVEIDPTLIDIAREYFNYQSPDNVAFIAQDARVFANQTTNQYDVVLVDAFSDISVPPTLLTKEYGNAIAKLTTPEGVVAVNMIAGFESQCFELFTVLNAPYVDHFSYNAYAAAYPDVTASNIITIHSRAPLPMAGYTEFDQSGTRYTDNFIPAERLQFACTQQRQQ